MPKPLLGDVKAQYDDVRGLQGPTSWWKGKTPLGLGLPECLGGNVLLSWCHPLVSLCPWLGSQHPPGGLLAPWRSKLIISHMFLSTGHGLTTTRSTPSMGSQVTGIIAMSITSSNQITQTCASNPLLPRQMLKDVMQFNKPILERVSGCPIGLILLKFGVFPK
jgi:hypothetical protein